MQTRLLTILISICLAYPQDMIVRRPIVVVGGGGSPAAFSDNFDRANSGTLGGCWTEEAGDAEIASNRYRLVTGSFGVVTSVCSTSTGSLTQYAMVTIDATNPQYPWIVFRYTDSSSPYYAFQLDGGAAGELTWYKFDNAADTSGTQIGSNIDLGSAFSTETLAITITGTGANTDIRVWRAATGLPSAADNWNGDTTPTASWLATDPGANAVDSGMLIGIGGQQGTTNTVPLDNFFGGGL